MRRRAEFELRKAEARAHILEGLKIALDHLDEVIKLIRASKTPVEARIGLVTRFGLSTLQAQAILDMQLQRLTGLERQKIIDELAELVKLIEKLRAILSNDELVMAIVLDELRAIRTKYGDERRTDFIEETGDFRVEDLIADEDVVITATHTGYIKRTALEALEAAAWGQRPHRHVHARGRRRSTPLRGEHPRVHPDFPARTAAAATGCASTTCPRSAAAARASRSPTW